MRIGVIGLGFMGMTHVKALTQIATAELAAVASSDPTKLSGDLRQVGGNLGIQGELFDFSRVHKFTDWRDLIASPEIDAVDICSPTHLHETMAIAALEAGKHVLVEKPLALTPEGAQRVLDAARRTGQTFMAAQVLRFFPMYQALKQADLGRPRSAFFRRRCAAPAWSQWLLDPAQSGGAVIDLLIHDIDLCLHLFGQPTAVSATGAQDLAKGIDVLTGQLHYPHLDSVVVSGGWHHPKSYPFSMEYTVVYDQGTLEYSSAGRPVTQYLADGSHNPVELPDKDGYVEEIRYFIDCCLSGNPPTLCPPSESVEAVRIAHLLHQARAQLHQAPAQQGVQLPCP